MLGIDITFQFPAAQSMEDFHCLDCSSLKIGKEPVITRFLNFAGRASRRAELPLFLTDVSSGFFARDTVSFALRLRTFGFLISLTVLQT
jgi:hypothetical protein